MSVIPVDEQFIGAGKIYIDGVLFANTRDNNVWRILQEKAAPKLNSVRGHLARTDYINVEMAEMEFTAIELASTRLPVYVPGATVTAQSGDGVLAGTPLNTTLANGPAVDYPAGVSTLFLAAVTNATVGDVVQIGPSGATREFRKLTRVGTLGASGTGTGVDVDYPTTYAHVSGEVIQEIQSGTLSLDSAAGATNIKVSSTTGLADGDFIRVGYPSESEVRKIAVGGVGSTGAGGIGVTVEVGFNRPHRSGDNFYEVTNEGTTLIESPLYRRLQAADYHAYELRVPGTQNREVRFGIRMGINIASPTIFEAADSEIPMGPRLTIQSRINPDNIEQSQWYITRVPAS